MYSDLNTSPVGQPKPMSPFAQLAMSLDSVGDVRNRLLLIAERLVGPSKEAQSGSPQPPMEDRPCLARAAEITANRVNETVRQMHEALTRIEAILP